MSEKLYIKPGVMGNDYAIPEKITKYRQYLLGFRLSFKHFIADSMYPLGLVWYFSINLYKTAKLFCRASPLNGDSAYLNNPVASLRRQPCRFNIKNNMAKSGIQHPHPSNQRSEICEPYKISTNIMEALPKTCWPASL